MSLGTVVAGGLTFTITGLHIRQGRLEITAIRHSPVPAMENEPATVFGEDGQGYFQGPDAPGASITIRAIKRRETAMLTLTLTQTSVTAA